MSITQAERDLNPLDHERSLFEKITKRDALVGVIGIGYVGLPLAVEKAKVGYRVIGYDQSAIRVAQVNRGSSYIQDVEEEELGRVVREDALEATTDFSTLGSCDVVVICVPTPLTPNKDPDISYIREAGAEIAQRLRPGQLICLESTTYPGTTEEVLVPILAATGLTVGRDYFVAYSPERVDPGNKRYTTKNTNKVVGGVTPACLHIAAHFYQQTILKVLPVPSPRVAEMTKVFENTFRAVNIALVNEMALLCDRMGIDIWEVIDAAATKPFGMMRFNPGPGVGGHCIPLDPFYLAWKARQYNFHSRFIELAGEINNSMPYFVRDKLIRALNDRGKPLKGSRILIVGISYKRDISDSRESPALQILELLVSNNALVDYHDPLVPTFRDAHGTVRHSVALTSDALSEADCILITTDHSNIDWTYVVQHSRMVIDTRNATKDVLDEREKIIRL